MSLAKKGFFPQHPLYPPCVENTLVNFKDKLILTFTFFSTSTHVRKEGEELLTKMGGHQQNWFEWQHVLSLGFSKDWRIGTSVNISLAQLSLFQVSLVWSFLLADNIFVSDLWDIPRPTLHHLKINNYNFIIICFSTLMVTINCAIWPNILTYPHAHAHGYFFSLQENGTILTNS